MNYDNVASSRRQGSRDSHGLEASPRRLQILSTSTTLLWVSNIWFDASTQWLSCITGSGGCYDEIVTVKHNGLSDCLLEVYYWIQRVLLTIVLSLLNNDVTRSSSVCMLLARLQSKVVVLESAVRVFQSSTEYSTPTITATASTARAHSTHATLTTN